MDTTLNLLIGEEMNRRFFTVVLILLLLASWVVIIMLARDNQMLLNALEIAEKSLDQTREEVGELSNTVERLMRESNRGNDWNEEAIPEYRR